MNNAIILQANALHIPLADKSVQCVVTSPPYYDLRDYGIAGQIGLEETPAQYVEKMVAVFREVRRVLKDDGVIWVNLGDTYSNEGKNGGHSFGKNYTSAAGGYNQVRNNRPDYQLPAKQLLGIPWRVAFALQADGWYLRSDIIWHKPNPMPESVTDRPTKAHEYVFLLSKSARYFYDADAIREPHQTDGEFVTEENKKGSWAIEEKNGDGWQGMGREARKNGKFPRLLHPLGRNKRTVWTISTQSYSGAHFATYPEKLVEPCILAGSKPGDIVLDPFNGSGTTGRVAAKFGRRYFGLELNPEYIKLNQERFTVQQFMSL